jgi:hypothetical protein
MADMLPSTERRARLREAALAGADGRDWYTDAEREIRTAALAWGQPAAAVAAASSATSVRTPVRASTRYTRGGGASSNLGRTRRVLKAWAAGKSVLSTNEATGEPYMPATQPGTAAVVRYEQCRGRDPSAGTATRCVQSTFPHPEHTKTHAFVRNLLGDSEAVTIDRIMGRGMGVPPRPGGSVNEPDITHARYRATVEDVRAVARELGWTPRQVQAAAWTSWGGSGTFDLATVRESARARRNPPRRRKATVKPNRARRNPSAPGFDELARLLEETRHVTYGISVGRSARERADVATWYQAIGTLEFAEAHPDSSTAARSIARDIAQLEALPRKLRTKRNPKPRGNYPQAKPRRNSRPDPEGYRMGVEDARKGVGPAYRDHSYLAGYNEERHAMREEREQREDERRHWRNNPRRSANEYTVAWFATGENRPHERTYKTRDAATRHAERLMQAGCRVSVTPHARDNSGKRKNTRPLAQRRAAREAWDWRARGAATGWTYGYALDLASEAAYAWKQGRHREAREYLEGARWSAAKAAELAKREGRYSADTFKPLRTKIAKVAADMRGSALPARHNRARR